MTGALMTTSAALLLFVFGAAVLQFGDRMRPSQLVPAVLVLWLAIIGLGVVLDAGVSWVLR